MTWMIPVIVVAVVATATLSGVFGMAGGLVLMGVYAFVLPVSTAMVLHGVTQVASNGARVALFRRHVCWRALAWYGLGAVTSLAIFTFLAIRVDRAVLLLILGGIPILVALIPTPGWLRIESPAVAVAGGAVSTAAQLLAGVAGPLVDLFFVKGRLDRYQVMGTKAATQTFGHLLKIFYHGALIGSAPDLPAWLYLVAIGCAFVGARVGKHLLASLSDVGFRRWSTRIVVALGTVCVARGVADLLFAPR